MSFGIASIDLFAFLVLRGNTKSSEDDSVDSMNEGHKDEATTLNYCSGNDEVAATALLVGMG